MSNANDANWYGNVFKTWQAKQLGPKPTADMLASIHKLGARPGKQALAIAMGLRDCGVTGSQIVIACGAPQLNKMRGFITDALLKREAVPPSADGHTVYKLAVTAKGAQRIKRTETAQAKAESEAAAKPVAKASKAAGKAKGTAKSPRKAKPVETATPASEAAPATDTADSQPQA